MKVLMIASECSPLAKTGGLADAVAGLGRSLTGLGLDVALVMPGYREALDTKWDCQPTGIEMDVPMGEHLTHAAVWNVRLGRGLPVYLIREDSYFLRDGLYGASNGDFPDNAERFIFFSKCALQLAQKTGPWKILHCNDWQSSLVAVYHKLNKERAGLNPPPRVVLSIHNLAYQGAFPQTEWNLLNVERRHFDPDGLEFYGRINFLKGGILFADALVTVSKKYAEEIRTREFGCGLEGVLAARAPDLFGILNGADYQEWDPEHDPHIKENYSRDDLQGKPTCKSELQEIFDLPPAPSTPILGMVSRLDRQKGIDLLLSVLEELACLDLQLVLLGAGNAQYEKALASFHGRAKKFGIRIGFDNTLAHKIEAGSDMFLMPSSYEPCGLNQIYSLRYGTIPIVRATGGLDDTVQDFDAASRSGVGFKFTDYSGTALLAAVKRALGVYGENPTWRELMRRAMACDFSWEKSAREYLALYRSLTER